MNYNRYTLPLALILGILAFALSFATPAQAAPLGYNENCSPVGSARVDPIVTPGVESMHIHEFFGTLPEQSTTSVEDMRGLDNQCFFRGSDQPAYSFNSYWMPKMTLRNGEYATPTGLGVYSKPTPGENPRDVKPYPTGLKYVLGDPQKIEKNEHITWKCLYGQPDNFDVYTVGRMPWKDCKPGYNIRIYFDLPSCSDGRADSANHRTHMAYPDPRKGCPASHPRPVPRVILNFGFRSGMMGGAKFYNAGEPGERLGVHADIFSATKYRVYERHINECFKGGSGCGNTGIRK